jgi:hypothetical protein
MHGVDSILCGSLDELTVHYYIQANEDRKVAEIVRLSFLLTGVYK